MKRIIATGVAVAITVGGLLFGITSTKIIDPGYCGIEYNMNGGLKKQAINQGWHYVSPFSKLYIYPISTETFYMSADKQEGSETDESFIMRTKEGGQLKTSVQIGANVEITKVSQLFEKFRGQNMEYIIKVYSRGILRDVANTVCSEYNTVDAFNKRSEISIKILKEMNKKMNPLGIQISSLSITDIAPDQTTQNAIQQRIIASQEEQRLRLELQNEKISAEKLVVKARAEGDAKLAQAQAEAQANRLISESISPQLIDLKRIESQNKQVEKWNGQMPTTIMGQGTNALFQIK